MKSSKIICFLVILFLVQSSGFGQETDYKNEFSFFVGPSFLARQDLIFSPMIHRDASFLNVGVAYQRHATFYQKLSFGFGNFNPMVIKPYDFSVFGESKTAYPHNFNFVDIDYCLGKKIKEYKKSRITAGLLFAADIQALDYVYGRSSSFGYYATFSLGVFAKHDLALTKKSKLTTSVQLPLFAWLARSPYLVNDDQFIENTTSHSGFKTFMAFMADGDLVTWNSWQTLDANFQYAYMLTNKWQIGASYYFSWSHASAPRNLISFRQSINCSAQYWF